ncbi:MAG TPA: nuclear transport factor 2 family protein [Terracidiphilus sp.]|nr:nuclear transport factor 2 family protein [Terracidiphilus sp.]
MDEAIELLKAAYRDFNARRLDAVLALMQPDVAWPNGWEGGYVHGHEGVRDYWTRQWAVLDPHVEPVAIRQEADGRMAVEVHQVVRDREGKLLADTMVRHVYTLRGGLIERMDIDTTS